MARPVNPRKVFSRPKIKGFIPMGYYASDLDTIYLSVEEYESIRLKDYMGLSQLESSEHMGVSRPTLTRIYEKARMKIAEALCEGKQILIQGGNVIYHEKWHVCNNCESKFNTKGKTDSNESCPLCGSKNVVLIENDI
ncbi:MAG: DUF134 domain-containing protein [Flavobacteriales bacterium]|nr:DUF134 domain-containing protein [Flavobacteriales bacterium]